MKMKRVCSKCDIAKNESDFPFRNKLKGSRHSYCLECGRLQAKDHYSRHIPYYVRKASLRRKSLLEEINGKVYEYLKTHPCVDCGEDDPIVLEFDHVRGKKSYNVSAMGWLALSWNSLEKEISKCEVRCANCHRRKTAERRGSYRFNRFNGPLAQSG